MPWVQPDAISMVPGTGPDFAALREDFPILADGSLHYLDSAASAQKPAAVIDAINACYRHDYGPIHRGLYPLAETASQHYEDARARVARFVNAVDTNEIAFTRSATEAINLVAQGFAANRLEPGDEVWVSAMEHHSNFLPWQRVCALRGARLRVIPIDDTGRLDLDVAEGLFGERTRLIAITQLSNVLGTINPVEAIVRQAQSRSIPVLVDAAQSVGHMTVDVQQLGCDFLVASAHKLCGPTGIGFLYGRAAQLAQVEPLLLGGGMVDRVGLSDYSLADVPARFEAGSPNLAGAVGLAAAIDYLDDVGLDAIEAYLSELTVYAHRALSDIAGLRLFGPDPGPGHGGILTFDLAAIHPHDLAQVAADHQVAIRAGHHCCQPLMQRLGVSSTARASFHLYNTEVDIDRLVVALADAKRLFGRP